MRRGNLVAGSIITLVGVLLLINQLIPSLQLLKFIFPLVLIVLGLWFLFGRRLFMGKVNEETLAIPLDGAREAEIKMRHGAGTLVIKSLQATDQLLAGTFSGGIEHELERTGDRVRLSLKTPDDMFFGFPGINFTGYTWSLGLGKGVNLKINLQGGASEAEMDLTDLMVSELILKTGASSTLLTLPASAGFTSVKIEAGAAKVVIHVPRGVAGRIRARGGVSSINVDTARFTATRDGYVSPDYDAANNKVEIFVSTGVGSVEIS